MGTYSRTLPPIGVILLDLTAALFTLVPVLTAWGATLAYLRRFWGTLWLPHLVLGAPFVLLGSFLASVAVLRVLIPKMRPGVFDTSVNKGFAAWLLTLYLSQAIRVAGLKPLVYSFYHTRFLYWWVMGARIAYGINCSPFLNVSDFPLITIRKGVTLGAYSHVAAHIFRGDKLILAPVVIGKEAYLGMRTTVGPGTHIGDRAYISMDCDLGLHARVGKEAWVGVGNRIVGETVPDGAKIGHFEWEYGDPRWPLKRDAGAPADPGREPAGR